MQTHNNCLILFTHFQVVAIIFRLLCLFCAATYGHHALSQHIIFQIFGWQFRWLFVQMQSPKQVFGSEMADCFGEQCLPVHYNCPEFGSSIPIKQHYTSPIHRLHPYTERWDEKLKKHNFNTLLGRSERERESEKETGKIAIIPVYILAAMLKWNSSDENMCIHMCTCSRSVLFCVK